VSLKFFTVAEVAELFNCSEKQVLELVRSGELYGARFGRSYAFSQEDIEECYEKRRLKTAKDLLAGQAPALP